MEANQSRYYFTTPLNLPLFFYKSSILFFFFLIGPLSQVLISQSIYLDYLQNI